VIAAASIGNALEFYDFIVYGFFATAIAATFFPSHDQTSGLLLTFATFGVSFLARPVGAAVLGGIADRHGRRLTMGIAIWLMTAGSFVLAVTPGAAKIGIAAPVIVLLGRLVQGFSLGGEYGAATAFLLEHEPARARFAASFQTTSQYVAAALASGVGWLLGLVLTAGQFDAWGFRIAFGLGTLIGPVGIVLRRRLDETGAFLDGVRPEAPVRRVLTEQPGRLAIAAATIAVGTGVTYVAIYLPTYAVTVLHMRLHAGLGAAVLSYVAALGLTLVAAVWVQQARPLRTMAVSVVAVTVVAWPLFAWLQHHADVFGLTVVRVALSTVGAPYFVLVPSMLAGLFGAESRVTGLSIGYTLGVVLFGAFAPVAVAWLVRVTGDPTAPAFFVVGMGVVTLVALAAAARPGASP
jgi:MHS family proline/betaine transporter-like MFS transporter